MPYSGKKKGWSISVITVCREYPTLTIRFSNTREIGKGKGGIEYDFAAYNLSSMRKIIMPSIDRKFCRGILF